MVSAPDSEDSWSHRLPLIVRITSHIAVWASVLTTMSVLLSKGWIAVGDDAAIAIRAFQSLSLHPPLVGMYSTAGNGLGHSLYDPGPLVFWLLAIPVHVDTVHGALWGAGLLWGAALSLAVEAVWSTRLWAGCAAIAFVAVDLLWLTPLVFENLLWNAYLPVPFLVASIALAWVVGTGSFGWWPPLILVASVASQSHLTFVIPCVALTLLAPVIGVLVSGKPARYRWLPVGLGVALACWLAPLLQSTGSNSNLAALLHSNSGQSKMGMTFGLQVLAAAGSPSPIWLTHEPVSFFPVGAFIGENSANYGVFILVLVALIAAGSYWKGHRALCALSTVCLVSLASVTITFAIFPVKNAVSVDYLIVCLWVVGILLWVVVIWAIASSVMTILGRLSVQRVRDLRSPPGAGVVAGPPGQLRQSKRWSAVLLVLLVGPVALVGSVGALNMTEFQPTDVTAGWTPAQVTMVDRVTAQIERALPRGAVAYSIKWPESGSLFDIWISEAVAWRLKADGWQPGLFSFGASFTGLSPARHAAFVVVTMDGTRVVSAVLTPCRSPVTGCP